YRNVRFGGEAENEFVIHVETLRPSDNWICRKTRRTRPSLLPVAGCIVSMRPSNRLPFGTITRPSASIGSVTTATTASPTFEVAVCTDDSSLACTRVPAGITSDWIDWLLTKSNRAAIACMQAVMVQQQAPRSATS